MNLIQLLRRYTGREDLQVDGEPESSDNQDLVPDLPACVADWTEEWREAFEERAALLEYEDGLSRDGAEREAEMRQRAEYRRQQQHIQGYQGEV